LRWKAAICKSIPIPIATNTMRIYSRSLSQQVFSAIVATVLTLILSGCGIGIAGGSSSGNAPVTVAKPGTISGGVHGGQQPITGAIIQLYEVGSTGYTTGMATPLISSTNQTGGVSAVTISSGGSGYTSNFPVTFTGGGSGASGAAGTAVVSGGAVTSVTITSAGTGYTSAPSVSFTNGSGSGAGGTALIVGSSDAMTDASGSFSITGDYNCDPGSYVYIASYGGNPGAGAVNPNIALIAALGSCSLLKAYGASTYININEVTTVGAAYAMAQFTGGSNFGVSLSAQPGVAGTQAPADNFTTSSTNTQGIANAMAIASVLADNTFGYSPGSNANGTATPEYWQVNNIANILAGCVNSASPFTNCTTLYSNVNPLNGTTTPADTLQAVLALAQSPVLTTSSSGQIHNLFGIIPTTAPFNPYSAAYTAISDFTLGIAYNPVVPGASPSTLAATLLFGNENIAFDQYGNAWIANVIGTGTNEQGVNCTTIGTANCDAWIVELDPTGNPIPAGSGSVGLTYPTATVNNFMITSYSLGSSAGASPTGTATTFQGINNAANDNGGTQVGMAVDTNNNVWVADYQSSNVMVIPGSSGAVYTSAGPVTHTYNGGNYTTGSTTGAYGYPLGYTVGGTNAGLRPTALTIDGSNDVFISTLAGTAGSSVTGKTTSSIGTTSEGLITLVGGSPSNVNYSAVKNSPLQLAIDSGAQGTNTNDSISGTTIPGAPFLWTSTASADWVNQSYTTTGGGTTNVGYVTPVASSAPTSASATDVGIGTANAGTYTKLETTLTVGTSTASPGNGTLFPTVGGDWVTAAVATSNLYGMGTDGYGNVWASTISNYVDNAATVRNTLVKITPSYNCAGVTTAGFNATNAATCFTWTEFHDMAGMSSSVTSAGEARFFSSDGTGNIWFALNSGTVGGISNTGTALSPAYPKSLAGATPCSSCYFMGTATVYARTSTAKQPQTDLSGNLWIPEQHAPFPNLTVLVGLAAPLASPSSSALAAGKYALKP